MFGWETEFLQFLEGKRTGFLNELFNLITMIGEETVIVVLIAIIYFMFNKELAKKVCFITVASTGLNGIIKNFVKLPRAFARGDVSCVRPETATGYSFPSGHTQTIATWSTVFALNIKKAWAMIIALLATVTVAFSRLYLGAHYPLDVIVGSVLGIGIALILSNAFDRTDNELKLYAIALLILTPFIAFFLIEADPQFKGLYKSYGMMAGILAGSAFEKKYVSFGYDIPLWKKLLRVVIGLVFAIGIKEGLKLFYFTDITRITMLLDAARYFCLIAFVMGILPWIFKKIRL